ncbi:hypothetical protein LUX09_17430 [Streptomyces albogriseolus]|nr:hypothetical protein [Streptomyces albogriseolus]
MEHDLVVFVPGFLGTRLCRDGQDVWARCSERLLDSASSALTEAALPPGLGDALPEAPHRLDAGGLLQVPDSVPGLLSCLGYPDLRSALGDPLDAQFVPFGYDWRLSHRLAARQLGERVARELDRWRAGAAPTTRTGRTIRGSSWSAMGRAVWSGGTTSSARAAGKRHGP